MLNMQLRLHSFLDKRIPQAREFHLDHRKIFIFPSRFGALYLFLCLGLFLLGANYQNNLMSILCYFLIALFLLNLFVSYQNFSKLHVQLGKTHDGYVNDTIQLPIWFNANDNQQEKPHGMLHLSFIGQPIKLLVDLDKAENPHYLALPCEKRGRLRMPRITLNSYYPLGLFRCWTHLAFESELLVYPAPKSNSTTLRSNEYIDQEQSSNQSQSGHDDFDTLAAYRPGEPLYHVAWKQLAKGRGMITKQFSSSVGSIGWLNLHPVATAQIETRLSELCFEVLELTRNDQVFGLDLGHQKIEPDKGIAHQTACLRALARFPETAANR